MLRREVARSSNGANGGALAIPFDSARVQKDAFSFHFFLPSIGKQIQLTLYLLRPNLELHELGAQAGARPVVRNHLDARWLSKGELGSAESR